jgi:hypothetical protein
LLRSGWMTGVEPPLIAYVMDIVSWTIRCLTGPQDLVHPSWSMPTWLPLRLQCLEITVAAAARCSTSPVLGGGAGEGRASGTGHTLPASESQATCDLVMARESVLCYA